jgi:hypothetical protein
VSGPAGLLAADLASPTGQLGEYVALFVPRFLSRCAARMLELDAAEAASAEAAEVVAASWDEASGLSEDSAREAAVESSYAVACERALAEAAAELAEFEAQLLDGSFQIGRGGPIEEDEGGLMLLLETMERSFQPQCLPELRALHERARGSSATARLDATRRELRGLHPSILGLREPLVSSGGSPASTAIEAGWIYAEGVETIGEMGKSTTLAGMLGLLARATEELVATTKGRCDELSADDLVPLLTLALVGSRAGIAFEAYVLDELLPDLLSTGRESYCVCTMQVALGFLREVVAAPGGSAG